MRVPISIAVWFAIFTSWLWLTCKVGREFRYTGKVPTLRSLTFYTFGVAGVLLLIGSRKRSPLLALWVEYLLESKSAEKLGGVFLGKRAMARFRYGARDLISGLRRGGEECDIMIDDDDDDYYEDDEESAFEGDIMIDEDSED